MKIELIRGEEYQIFPNTRGLPHEKIYVMNQFVPSTKKEWATFFSIVGEEYWRIFRTRIPIEGIIRIKGKIIDSREEPVTKVVWPHEDYRKPLVQEWLNETKSILKEMDYGNSESFRGYFERD